MSFIDNLMEIPSYNVYQANEGASNPVSNLIYKTQPKNSKSEDGHYRSVVRVINNPYDLQNSIVKTTIYSMNDANGWFTAPSSLSIGDRSCPIFTSWKKFWFSGDESKKQFAKDNYSKREEQWVTVQIVSDDNFPELVGQIKLMKLPTAIWNKMNSKMNPSQETKKAPQPIMDWLIGNLLEIDVQPGPDDPAHPERKQREISYDLCDFSADTQAITKTDGTDLFDEDEQVIIEEWATAKTESLKAKYSGKETAKSKAAVAKIEEIKEQVKALYSKAFEYLKQVAPNVQVEKGYKPWDEQLTARVNAWISDKEMQGFGGVAPATASKPVATVKPAAQIVADAKPAAPSVPDDVEEGLPF